MARVPPFRFLSFLFVSVVFLFSALATPEEFDVVSHPAKFRLSPGKSVENSLGAKTGVVMACNRVYVRGASRMRNLGKYAHALKVNAGFGVEDLNFRVPTFEICFHRNATIGVGMCPPGKWERVTKGHWVRSMSPYDSRILDIRMVQSSSSNTIEVSTEEEFMLHRVIFLIAGIVLMTLAHVLSESVVFYYSSAMAIGVILVVLIILFQGMKVLPTGRKSSLAIVMYSSVVGVATFLLRYLSGLLRSILVEIGISEDMHNPLAIFLIICIVIAGAWMGFWSVRKLVLDEFGSIDMGVAYFVEWTIRIFAAAMILESSLDTLLATEALILGMAMAALSRINRKLKLLRHLYRQSAKYLFRRVSQDPPSNYHGTEYGQIQHYDLKTKSKLLQQPIKPSPMAPCSSYLKGQLSSPAKRTPNRLQEEDAYYSTFHDTPERKRFSKEEWKTFTRESTRKAMEELVSSPNFGRWAADNVERINVTPPKESEPLVYWS